MTTTIQADIPDRDQFAFRLRTARAAGQITASATARHLGVHRNTVAAWESGVMLPSADRDLDKLAAFYGVDAEWLRTGQRVA